MEQLKNHRKAIRNITILILLLFTNKGRAQTAKPLDQLAVFSTKKIWSIDSCGHLGLKDSLSRFLIKNRILINKPISFAVSLIGNANFVHDLKEGKGQQYDYVILCKKDEETGMCLPDPGFIISRLIITTDKKGLIRAVDFSEE